MYRRLAAADAMVLCSKRLSGKGEGVPTVALEALALGVPCILSNAASPTPAVTDTQSYWSFEAGNAVELAQLLTRAVQVPAATLELRMRGPRATKLLDWSQIAAGVERVYEKATESGPQRARGPNA